MQFNFDSTHDIDKLIGLLRLMVKGKFRVSRHLLAAVLQRVERFAREQGLKIVINAPSGERILTFTGGGLIAGAALGYLLGQLPGALAGAVLGGCAGYGAAHMTLVMTQDDDGQYVMLRAI